MHDSDLGNVLVLALFGGALLAVIGGYVVAWRSKKPQRRVAGSVITALVLGFAGLFMFFWLMGAVTPFPPPDGSSILEPVLFFLAFLPLPLGAFLMCVTLIRRAYRHDQECQNVGGPPL